MAEACRMQKDFFCGFQNLGRGGGNPGISPGGRRCDALGAGKQKTTIKNNKNNIICTEKTTENNKYILTFPVV